MSEPIVVRLTPEDLADIVPDLTHALNEALDVCVMVDPIDRAYKHKLHGGTWSRWTPPYGRAES